jgi:hypothetical protein
MALEEKLDCFAALAMTTDSGAPEIALSSPALTVENAQRAAWRVHAVLGRKGRQRGTDIAWRR